MVTVKIVKTDLIKNLENAIKTLNQKVGKVGWFEKSRYTGNQSNVGPVRPIQVAQVAYIHEVSGVPSQNVPARPFIRPTIAKKSGEWRDIAAKKSKQVIEGKITADYLMDFIGQKAVGDISKSIKELWSPALSPATIRARMSKYTSDRDLKESTSKRRKKEVQKFVSAGFYKPLIDTGLMLSTLINKVENE